jgi:hypothetical protein
MLADVGAEKFYKREEKEGNINMRNAREIGRY